jgi:hypothetical protein
MEILRRANMRRPDIPAASGVGDHIESTGSAKAQLFMTMALVVLNLSRGTG